MDYKPASKESIQKLYENMGSNFIVFVPQLCSSVSSLERLEQLDEEELGEVLYLITHSSTVQKRHHIEKISEVLKLGLKVEVV